MAAPHANVHVGTFFPLAPETQDGKKKHRLLRCRSLGSLSKLFCQWNGTLLKACSIRSPGYRPGTIAPIYHIGEDEYVNFSKYIKYRCRVKNPIYCVPPFSPQPLDILSYVASLSILLKLHDFLIDTLEMHIYYNFKWLWGFFQIR